MSVCIVGKEDLYGQIRILKHLHLPQDRAVEWAQQVAIVVGASLFVALCARVTMPLPFTPVPSDPAEFRRAPGRAALGLRAAAFAALRSYLAEGAAGHAGIQSCRTRRYRATARADGRLPDGLSICGGAGRLIMERGKQDLRPRSPWLDLAEIAALRRRAVLARRSDRTPSRPLFVSVLYWFVFAEVIKIMLAAAIAVRLASHAIKVQVMSRMDTASGNGLSLRALPRQCARSPLRTAPTPTTLSCFMGWPPTKSGCPACVSRIRSATSKP